MTSLMGLLKDDILTLQNNRYKLLGVAGGGGSSIVYLAQPVGSISSRTVMIKEFVPDGCGITRITTGPNTDSLIVPPAYQEKFNKMKKRAHQESKIAKALQNDRADIDIGDSNLNPDKTNNPYLLEYSDPIEANGTLYTVIEATSGETLKSLMKRDFFEDKDFVYICNLMKEILDAVEYIHSRNHLHLDIAPDNIFIPKYKPGYTEIKHIHLLDYNSAVEKGVYPDGWISSYKEGYSAPELERYGTKFPDIEENTDLYSVAAIFFELLTGSPPSANSREFPKEWHLSADKGILKGASGLLVDKVNRFLWSGIHQTPSKRCKNAAEMRDEINELLALSKRSILRNIPQRFEPGFGHFVGRKDYLERIDAVLESNGYVHLEGIRGIGKTELAREYAEKHRSKYDAIQFVTYRDNLLSTVALGLRFSNYDENFHREIKRESYKSTTANDEEATKKALEAMFDDKIRFLEESNERLLIIVDNYNVPADDHFRRFVPGKHKVIITSHVEHEGKHQIVVEGMENEKEVLELFCEYYEVGGRKIAEEDKPVILKIGEWALGHTMTIELVAAAFSKRGKAFEEIFRQLEEGISSLGAYAKIDKEELISANEREKTIFKHLKELFDMSEILNPEIPNSENYAFIMVNMAITPSDGILKGYFYDWALSGRYHDNEDEAERDIGRLEELRWVHSQYDDVAGGYRISLHPIISEIAREELKPDSVKCFSLINGLIGFADKCEGETYAEQESAIKLLGTVCERIKDETVETATFYSWFASLNNSLAHYATALEWSEKALAIREKVLGTEHPDTAASYNNIAFVCSSQGDYVNALEWYEKALAIDEKVLGTEHPDTAMTYNNIASVYSDQGDYVNALEWYGKALAIFEKVLGTEHPDTATTYNNIALVYNNRGDYAKALEWNEKALAIREKVLGTEHPSTATTYNNIALVYDNQGDYANALPYYSSALAIFEKALGTEHPSTAATYNNIAVVKAKQNESGNKP